MLAGVGRVQHAVAVVERLVFVIGGRGAIVMATLVYVDRSGRTLRVIMLMAPTAIISFGTFILKIVLFPVRFLFGVFEVF